MHRSRQTIERFTLARIPIDDHRDQSLRPVPGASWDPGRTTPDTNERYRLAVTGGSGPRVARTHLPLERARSQPSIRNTSCSRWRGRMERAGVPGSSPRSVVGFGPTGSRTCRIRASCARVSGTFPQIAGHERRHADGHPRDGRTVRVAPRGRRHRAVLPLHRTRATSRSGACAASGVRSGGPELRSVAVSSDRGRGGTLRPGATGSHDRAGLRRRGAVPPRG